MLVGNKADLVGNRKVKFEEANEFAVNNDLMFVEGSALTGNNVETVFINSATQILRKIEAKEIDMNKDHTGIRIGDHTKRKSCCKSD